MSSDYSSSSTSSDYYSSDEEDVLAVLAIIDLVVERRKELSNSRSRPYLQQRELNIYQELQVADRFGIGKYLRCSESDFEELLSLILHDIKKDSKHRSDVIPPEMRLGATLRFLATGDRYTTIMHDMRISKQQLSVTIPEVCYAIYNRLKEKYLKVPSTESEWRKISEEFNAKWNFPHATGALDGKQIKMDNTAGNVVLLALVDHDHNFLYIDVSKHEIISDRMTWPCLNSVTLNFPESEPLPGGEVDMPYVMLADDTFQMSKYIMKPYSGEHRPGSKKQVFNDRLLQASKITENTFGIMTSAFQIFKKPLAVGTPTVIQVVLACVALHNYLRRNKTSRDLYSPQSYIDVEENGQFIPGQWRYQPSDGIKPLPRMTTKSLPDESHWIRDEFADYFVRERNRST